MLPQLIGDEDKRRAFDSGGARGGGGGGFGDGFGHFGWPFGGGFGGFHQQQQQHRGGASADLYANAPLVTRLTYALFDAKVARSASAWVVNFYAPWCGHCVHIAPEWKRLATRLANDDDDIEVAAVNCDAEAQLCRRFGINSFPSIRLFTPAAEPPDDDAEAQPAEASADAEDGSAEASDAKAKANAKKREPPVAPTLLWAAHGGGEASADAFSSWAREHVAAAAAARVTTLTAATFAATVLDSPELWLIAFVARGVDWCPACAPVEVSLRKLSSAYPGDAGAPGIAASIADGAPAGVRFGVLDCEAGANRALCVTLQLGRPYTFENGDFPQLMGYPPGPYKALPERLLPRHAHYVSQLTDRIEHLAPLLRVALGVVPVWARAATNLGGGLPQAWEKHTAAESGKVFFYFAATAESAWEAPEGWDAAGPDKQTLRTRPPPPQPPPAHEEL